MTGTQAVIMTSVVVTVAIVFGVVGGAISGAVAGVFFGLAVFPGAAGLFTLFEAILDGTGESLLTSLLYWCVVLIIVAIGIATQSFVDIYAAGL